jgi:hypothetical protein
MSGRLAAAAAAGLFVIALVWMRVAAPPATSQTMPAAARPSPTGALPAPGWPSVPPRNPFEYAEPPEPSPARAPREPRAPAPSNALPEIARAPSAPAVKLIGLLRQGGALKAVLQVYGEVIVAAAGGEAGDYQVLSIDEERGVRLRARGGEELTLPPPGT